MFRRPGVYHPYKPSVPLSPAGFRLGDYVPRRCFNLFQGPRFNGARSPDSSPLTSPIRGGRYSSDDAPPTIRLGDLFTFEVFGSPKSSPTPAPERRLNPNLVPDKDALPFPHPRKTKHGPKHLSFTKDPHRRSQQLREKREAFRKKLHERHERRMARSRVGFSRLRREAEALMKPRHMNSEDRIFLEQLGNLAVDHQMENELEEWRERMARAAQETDQRRHEHEARDAEAAKLREAKTDEEALEEYKRAVEEFVMGEDEKREAHFRQLEEEAMRADVERQRVHEAAERKIRDVQEHLFRKKLARKALEEERQRQEEQERQLQEERERQRREEVMRRLQEETHRLREELERLRQAEREHQQREEQTRKLREEVERLRREAYERSLREERERLAREEQERQRAEEARRTAMEEQIRQHFVLYEAKWNELRTSNSISSTSIDVREMPWPVFSIISSADHITYQDVRAFLFHPQRPGVEGKSARDKVKSEVLRFHPDKFNTRIVPKIQLAQQEVAQEIAGAVARILTTIMNEEAAQK